MEDVKGLESVGVVPGDESTIEVQLVRQKWITLYSRSETSSSAAKIFMLVFLSEAYKELLHNCHLAISMPISSQQSTSTVTSDPLDVYYRFGGAALASLLHNCYKAMKSSTTSNKDVVANEIHILQALRDTEKKNVPEYLKYRDEGHMHFPCEELIPFLRDIDVCVKTIATESNFKTHGDKLVKVTMDTVYSKQELRESFKKYTS